MKKHFFLILFSISVCSFYPAAACTIFIVNDGQRVWVGNNEDGSASLRYRFFYNPARKKQYGYMTWSELYGGKILHGLSYLLPQGGMNEHGLFMDYTWIKNLPAKADPSKKNRKKEVVRDILKNCKTVEEAVTFINKYNLVRLTGAQLFIADASGDYAVVHGSFIERKSSSNFVLTNYPIQNGHTEKCWRREAAQKALTEKQDFVLNDVKQILNKTAQRGEDITNYSLAINLKNQTISLFHKGDFNKQIEIPLKDKLQKGKHHQNLSSLL